MHLRLDHYHSPLSSILLVTDDARVLRAVDFADYESRMNRFLRVHYGNYELEKGSAPISVIEAFDAYFEGELNALDHLPTETAGTPFQREVWQALRRIQPGTTKSYGEIAAEIGHPQASRAVGAANGSNPIAIVVPCHRVIGANGKLTGYGGGMTRKQWLLNHERKFASLEIAGYLNDLAPLHVA
jgi:methylated-DNA-[protein]-cysteine S-methyltransferase